MTLTLTESQRTLIALCLRIAREKFLENAKYLTSTQPTSESLRQQFELQSSDSLYLANLIDNAESVAVKEYATDHLKVIHGKCPVCGHYGEDCTGEVKP